MSALVSLAGVGKRYRTAPRSLFGAPRPLLAVDGVDLVVRPGRSLGLVGESGCGKSTLAKLAARLIAPSAGQVVVGEGLSGFRRSHVQMVFQDPLAALDARMTVGAQIEEVLEVLIGLAGSVRAERRDALLAQVGLPADFAQRYPHQLSGGQRQRMVIARALAAEPRLLICDEPLAALDVSVQAQMLGLLDRLARETGVTYLFITHQLQTVRHLCADVAVMYAGRIVEQGPTATVFDNPRHPYTRMLLSSVLDPRLSAEEEQLAVAGEPPDPADLPSGCAFAPRCPARLDRCDRDRPTIEALPDGRLRACHLPA